MNFHPWMDGKAVSKWHEPYILNDCKWSFDRYTSRRRGADKPSLKSNLLEAIYPLKEKTIRS